LPSTASIEDNACCLLLLCTCCCSAGIVDADFPTSRIGDDISQLLNPALQAAADSILAANSQLKAAGDNSLEAELKAAMQPMLRFVSQSEYSKPASWERLAKVLIKSHLLRALQQLVWSKPSKAGQFGVLRQYLQSDVPALKLRDAAWSNAAAMKPAWESSSSSSSSKAAKEHQACNKLLDAQRQLGLWWYTKLKGAQGSSTDATSGNSAAPNSRLFAVFEPRVGEFVQHLQLPSLLKAAAKASGCDPVGCIMRAVAAAVLVRLSAEAAHPCLIITADASSAGHTCPEQFGGLENAQRVYAPAPLAAGPGVEGPGGAVEQRVIGCAVPGVAYDAGLMLLRGGECQMLEPVRMERVVMVGHEGAY
jgi:hypothetical protein